MSGHARRPPVACEAGERGAEFATRFANPWLGDRSGVIAFAADTFATATVPLRSEGCDCLGGRECACRGAGRRSPASPPGEDRRVGGGSATEPARFARRAAGRLGGAVIAAICALPVWAGPVVTGAPETMFDWASERCARWDIPDAPARAWRGSDGAVRVIAGSEANRVSAGHALGAVVRDCAVVHQGAEADDPGVYDDRSWVASVFADGERVEGLAHVEYHGHLRDGCAGDYAACWRNAVVALELRDGRLERAGLVAALPYRYTGAHGRRAGYFNPSNILRDGDFLYVFVFAEAFGAQARGACLLRRPVAGGAADWRAWDGSGFTVRFADPYAEEIADPAAHVCAPLPGIASTVSGVVRHEPSGLFLAVTPATQRGADGETRSGIWWMTSEDLVTWSAPALLHEAPLLWRRDCVAWAAYAYPSLIDGASASANFDTVGGRFWLYLVEMPLGDGCRVGPERDLVRMEVSWPSP